MNLNKKRNRSEQVILRLTKDLKTKISEMAYKEDLKIQDFIRNLLYAEVRSNNLERQIPIQNDFRNNKFVESTKKDNSESSTQRIEDYADILNLYLGKGESDKLRMFCLGCQISINNFIVGCLNFVTEGVK